MKRTNFCVSLLITAFAATNIYSTGFITSTEASIDAMMKKQLGAQISRPTYAGLFYNSETGNVLDFATGKRWDHASVGTKVISYRERRLINEGISLPQIQGLELIRHVPNYPEMSWYNPAYGSSAPLYGSPVPVLTLAAAELFYNLTTKNAAEFKTGQRYVAVQAKNSTLTPLNQTMHAMSLIKTIPSAIKVTRYGQSSSINLYGIAVSARGLPVVSTTDAKKAYYASMIALYWPEQRVVQFEDGKTYVGVNVSSTNMRPNTNTLNKWFTGQTVGELNYQFGLQPTAQTIEESMQEPIGYVNNVGYLFGILLPL